MTGPRGHQRAINPQGPGRPPSASTDRGQKAGDSNPPSVTRSVAPTPLRGGPLLGRWEPRQPTQDRTAPGSWIRQKPRTGKGSWSLVRLLDLSRRGQRAQRRFPEGSAV